MGSQNAKNIIIKSNNKINIEPKLETDSLLSGFLNLLFFISFLLHKIQWNVEIQYSLESFGGISAMKHAI
jgi:hypothetical protein